MRSGDRLRSPTAHAAVAGWSDLEDASAGTAPDADAFTDVALLRERLPAVLSAPLKTSLEVGPR